jgi:hypothetical protein
MSMYDTDHSFRAKQDTAYGDRGEYETSVASVVESKLARARAMDADVALARATTLPLTQALKVRLAHNGAARTSGGQEPELWKSLTVVDRQLAVKQADMPQSQELHPRHSGHPKSHIAESQRAPDLALLAAVQQSKPARKPLTRAQVVWRRAEDRKNLAVRMGLEEDEPLVLSGDYQNHLRRLSPRGRNRLAGAPYGGRGGIRFRETRSTDMAARPISSDGGSKEAVLATTDGSHVVFASPVLRVFT